MEAFAEFDGEDCAALVALPLVRSGYYDGNFYFWPADGAVGPLVKCDTRTETIV